jgi:outer membrane protein assembly factor BamB
VRKWVAAVEADTGKMLWRTGDFVGLRSKTGSMDRISHLSMCAGDGQVFFVDRNEIVSLALDNGRGLWRAARPQVPEHRMRYDIRITDMCSLVYHDGILLFAQLNPDRRIDWREIRGRLHAFSARTGRELWSRPCASWGWGHPADVFVIDGLVWVHDFKNPFILGLDPATGEQKRKVSNFKAFDNGHHHRCYRNKATQRFLMTSYRGLEFIEWDSDQTHLNHWVRGTCRLGAFPCNGLIYSGPHPCDCYITSKLNGMLALAPVSGGRNPERSSPPLVRGPAYGTAKGKILPPEPGDWATYRHDPRRSGATESHVSADLRPIWEADLGGMPSSCTVAGGKVFAASVNTHDVFALSAEDGKRIWRYTVGGPVDTPPTIYKGLALFGSSDGWVTCLRASDGELVWSLRAAPEDRLLGAFGGLQSAWPVHGSVLVKDDIAYFVAGRSSFLDGGIFAYSVNPRTGEVLSKKNIRTSYTMPVDTGRNQSVNSGSLTDVLVADGESVCMRQLRLFGPAGDGERSGRQLRSTAGLLDDSWFNRTHWFLDDRPGGELLVHDEKSVYAVKAYATSDINSGFFNPATGGYELFAGDRKLAPSKKQDNTAKGARKKKRAFAPRWSVRVTVRVTAIVLSERTLFAAGTPDVLDAEEPWAAYEGRRGGRLLAFSAVDGKKLAEYRLSSAPVLDGMAAAAGRLYLSTNDGKLACWAGSE